MFLGHFAVGLGSKAAAPKASLGSLMAAPMFLDLLWPVFLLLGWESVRIDPGNTATTPLDFVSYPWSHSLLMAALWGALFSGWYWWRTRCRSGTIAVGVGVLSHWFMDAVVHRPDLPLYPGGSLRVGLGLWNARGASVVVEATLLAAGVWLYRSRTRPADRIGRHGFLAFVAFLVLAYAGSVWGPPPPDVRTLAIVGLSAWILPVWAGWFDRHRTRRGAAPSPAGAPPRRGAASCST